MSTLKFVWKCMFSPRLIKVYGNGPVEQFYEPQLLEKWGDQIIHSLYIIWKLGIYTSPFLVGILYQRGYFELQGLTSLSKVVTGVSVILVISYCIRGISRSRNPLYQQFMGVLEQAQRDIRSVKPELMKYEFEFSAWPVEYHISSKIDTMRYIGIHKPTMHQDIFQYITSLPFRVIAYLAVHSFGIRLIYPGSIGMLQMILEQSLLQGRFKLIESHRAERFKLKAVDGNFIDSILIDKRNISSNGNILVICSEGNAGFYEIGTIITPIEAGYSVLGWNHPGFGGSTGMPYPSQEQNAIDVLVQFAINKLSFEVENILFFGWSIGGYATSWAAMNYPDAKGVVIDATFDDILPLAINHMPKWWEPIVKLAIREHVNLNIFEQLSKYPGPILLIRRTDDEVICLKENDLSSNRGNHLLIKILKHRYPAIYEEHQLELLNDYLAVTGAAQEQILRKYNVDENMCVSLLQSYISEYSTSFPMKIGEDFAERDRSQMALFLASKHLKDFKATHCISLPGEMFHPPWELNIEGDFVFT
ncbi:phosphatidylserine lipase ABHD16A [Cylas formicarius]|uniref:phosphatidylserine lipase ABHD16A n=1 Tax=Cylas formicarius TaxID=197179 RepID=UPI0029584FB2|nr:phosphatidylserine lipase ABHD16A [Cylas formicarius]XP_060534496.1 phosphatidylserine lipase ABHD16A [Cylas formicarius]XP_060534497.1 phosphatidylserine lipase ABHD16A [Cylas formicarius]XP_060534498.1 phosphatidylserine lipase ABHD16A [Cylas formicarius]